MIRLVHCMKRKDGISIDEFRAIWNGTQFNDLIDRMLGLALTAGVKKNLTLNIDLNKALQAERGAKPPFDAVLEVVWQSGRDLTSIVDDAEFQQLTRDMEALQREFVDFQESRRFFTEYDSDQA